MLDGMMNAFRHARVPALMMLVLDACDAGSDADPNAPHEEDGRSSAPHADRAGHETLADGGTRASQGGFANGDGGVNGSSTGRDGGASEPTPTRGPSCGNAGNCPAVAPGSVHDVDLLFMVDDSGSMREEQAALRAQFPALIRALTTGDRDGNGSTDFAPFTSLHLGVVSSDMGLIGISGIDRCDGFGDDGVMRNTPSTEVDGCAAQYPRFLSYQAAAGDPNAIANDLACIATLGTDGCGFEQPLESALKALWPADDSRVLFLTDPQGFGAVGQGDHGGMNEGFLRNDPQQGLSVIAVVLVTDEDDCSSKDTRHWIPPQFLDPSVPADATLLQQGLNVRCHFNAQNLYVTERYTNGLKALRPGNEQLVVFGAIVGVPPETVSTIPADYAENPAAQAAFYDAILSHPKMQETVDDRGTPEPADDTLVSSCETATGPAYPPRRIVQVARGFGANGIVQSICQDDFGPAIMAIVDRIASVVSP